MTLRRLLSLWLGVIGEMFIITAEVVEPGDTHDELAIDQITQELAQLVRGHRDD